MTNKVAQYEHFALPHFGALPQNKVEDHFFRD